jgi:hypothetical protein
MGIVIQHKFYGLIADEAAEVLISFLVFFLFEDCPNLMLNPLKVTTSLTLRSRPSKNPFSNLDKNYW